MTGARVVSEIRVIAVLGAGTMGHGIAHAAAASGFETRLYDPSEPALAKARGQIETILKTAVDLGKAAPTDVDAALARLTATTKVAGAVSDADLVIEAAPERIDLKLQLMAEIERHAPASAVIATNTSALSITEMAGAIATPARVAGMHFFNPVHKMRLVEIVRALESADAALAAIEAVGPFELVDLVGLDTRLSILEYLHRSLGEKYRPCPLLAQYVRAGRLGRKVGRGVYEY